jgi:hypothetical protein
MPSTFAARAEPACAMPSIVTRGAETMANSDATNMALIKIRKMIMKISITHSP